MTAAPMVLESKEVINPPGDPQNKSVNNDNTTEAPVQDKEAEAESESVVLATPPSSNNEKFSPELLKMYYSRLFPYNLLHSWLSYDPLQKNPSVFSRREFSFTIEPLPGEEIYLRYQSFTSEAELRKAITRRQPRKIDLGAVFSHPPKDKTAANNFTTTQRELVFDIDLTDYDDIRYCGCQGAKICNKCWKFMNMAVKVLDKGLREDFGFQWIVWVYSGRRGVHAWICDESARNLSNEARSAVANYFEVSLGKKKHEGLRSPLHPMIDRAFEILEPMFIEYVLPETGNGLLASPEHWEPLLETLPKAATAVCDKLKSSWSGISGAETTPAEKWDEVKRHLNAVFGSASTKSGGGNKKKKTMSEQERDQILNWPVEVVLKYSYPRLDINVSKMQNHLLKSPFCVHPRTGRVCVPLQVEKIDEFDPFEVPTLELLMQELDEYQNKNRANKPGTNDSTNAATEWHKTSLKQYFEPFQKKFLDPMAKELRRKAREESEEAAAVIGDF